MDKRIKITNSKQFEALIAELENKPSLAKGFQRGSIPNNFKEDWEEITLKLNSIGPPIRDSDGWQKVWRDFKCKVKKKLVHNKAEVNATGGGRFKQITLSALEETAANLMQFDKLLNPVGVTQGIQSAVEEATILEQENLYIFNAIPNEEENLPSTSNAVSQVEATPKTKKRKQSAKYERHELLENHHEMQKQVFQEIRNTMEEMKNALKDSCRYQRRLWEAELKKIKMLEKQQQREDQLFEAEMKLKEIKMEIKKKELEVLEKQYKD